MDWLNTNFYREYGYGLCYPQIFPNHKRRSDEAHAATIEWAAGNAKTWLGLLDEYWIGPRTMYLCNNQLSVADYLGAGLVSLGEIIRIDFAKYPNVKRWLDTMKKQPSWGEINQHFYGFADAVKGQQFVTV